MNPRWSYGSDRIEPYLLGATRLERKLLAAARAEWLELLAREAAQRCAEGALLGRDRAAWCERWGWLSTPPPPARLWARRAHELLEWPLPAADRELLERCVACLSAFQPGRRELGKREPGEFAAPSWTAWPDRLELARYARPRALTVADVCWGEGRVEEAMQVLCAALPQARAGAERARHLVGVARSHERLERPRLALGVWERAAEEDPQQLDAQIQTLYLATRFGDRARERRALRRLALNVRADSGALAIEMEKLRRRSADAHCIVGSRSAERASRAAPAQAGEILLERARNWEASL